MLEPALDSSSLEEWGGYNESGMFGCIDIPSPVDLEALVEDRTPGAAPLATKGVQQQKRRRRMAKKRDPESHRQYYLGKKAALATLEAEASAKREQVESLIARQKELLTRELVLQLSIRTREEQMSVLEQLRDLGLSKKEQPPVPGVTGGSGDTPQALLVLLREAETALSLASRPGSGETHIKLEEGAEEQQQQPSVQQQQQQQQQVAVNRWSLRQPSGEWDASPKSYFIPSDLNRPNFSSSGNGSGGGSGRQWPRPDHPLSNAPLTKEEATQRYLVYMQEASKLLLEVDERDPATVERVERVTTQMYEDFKAYTWGRASLASNHSGQHITDPNLKCDDAFWESVMLRIELSEQEEDAVSAAYEHHMEALGAVRGRQHEVAGRLREMLSDDFRGLTAAREDTRRMEMMQLVATMEKLLKSEEELWLMGFKALQHTLPPLKIARILVAAFPYWPCAAGILHALQRRIEECRAARAAAAAAAQAAPPQGRR